MIRKATEKDLIQIGEIYEEILDHEAATVSYTNWQKGLYPTVAHARKAHQDDTLFVGEDENGLLYGCVNLNQIQPQEYANIAWTIDAAPEEVMVIHTLCIRPNCAGKGYGLKFVKFCEDHAREMGWPIIRLDTYEGNSPACSLYEGLGYHYAGTTDFNFENVIQQKLKCFEKKVK